MSSSHYIRGWMRRRGEEYFHPLIKKVSDITLSYIPLLDTMTAKTKSKRYEFLDGYFYQVVCKQCWKMKEVKEGCVRCLAMNDREKLICHQDPAETKSVSM